MAGDYYITTGGSNSCIAANVNTTISADGSISTGTIELGDSISTSGDSGRVTNDHAHILRSSARAAPLAGDYYITTGGTDLGINTVQLHAIVFIAIADTAGAVHIDIPSTHGSYYSRGLHLYAKIIIATAITSDTIDIDVSRARRRNYCLSS